MKSSSGINVVGVDLGGTKILASKINNLFVEKNHKAPVPKNASEKEVVDALIHTIEEVMDNSIVGIGVGAPSVVDVENGVVYDVQNIPSWKEVHLKSILENHFELPVFINNDANCFALGEKHFGKGRNYKDVVGLIVGTGIAAGLIINEKLYCGRNCGAGEFGMIPYKDQHLEYYASGQFFNNVHKTSGELMYQRVQKGDPQAQAMFDELGYHIGHVINTILYSIDPEIIIMGGSVSGAYHYFKNSMWKQINTLVYPSVLQGLKIETSSNPDIAVLGAAALCFEANSENKLVLSFSNGRSIK